MLSCKQFSSKTCTNRFSKTSESIICECGGIGRRARLRGVFERVRVQVPSLAPIAGCQACFFMQIFEKSQKSIGKKTMLYDVSKKTEFLTYCHKLCFFFKITSLFFERIFKRYCRIENIFIFC